MSIIAESTPQRVILDVDVGVDDYLALLLFLNAEKLGKVKIEAITCTMGNTSVDNACKNVVRLLELIGRTDIPVFRGSTNQILPPWEKIISVFGSDGFGGLEYDTEPDMDIIQKVPAATGMRNIVINNPNEITLILLAALTNVAIAIRLYDDFIPNIKEVWIMGGNYTGVGNMTPTAEYNFYVDPEAAFIVLDSITKPMYILTWEACLLPNISRDWRFDVFGKKENPEIQLLTRAERNIYLGHRTIWKTADSFLAAAYINPDIIVKKNARYASVELTGRQTRGQVVLDHHKKKKPNVIIIEEIDADKFKDLIMQL